MKFSLIAAVVVVLAAAHGSEAKSLVKRDIQPELDKLTKMFTDMSTSLTSATQDLVERMKAFEMTHTAQTYMDDNKAKIQPLFEKVQAEATRLQEQVKPLVADIEDQVKPLTDMMEKFFQQMVDQTKSLLPSQ